VSETDVVHRLAGVLPYEVFVLDHDYGGDCTMSEWIVVVHTVPIAPLDLSIRDVPWPRTWITQNVETIPEVRVDNFADETVIAQLELRLSLGSDLVYHEVQDIELEADSTLVPFFGPYVPTSLDEITLEARFLTPTGDPWVDTFSDNDEWSQITSITEHPVFRPISSIRRPGRVPMRGKSVDFDGDGDQDVIDYDREPTFWQNDGFGNYTDISDLINVDFPNHPNLIVVREFTGDGHLDVLIGWWNDPHMLLAGDGTGAFTDVTPASGLQPLSSGVGIGATPIDLEGDQDVDLILSSYYGQEIVAANDGGGHFTDVTHGSGIIDPQGTWTVSVSDLNGDMHPDVITGNGELSSNIFINDGDGSFTGVETPWGDGVYGPAYLFHYDPDGRIDILFDGSSQGRVLYRNLGDLMFEDITSEAGDLGEDRVGDLADVTGDLQGDIILKDLRDQMTLLLNHDGTFTDHTELLIDMDANWRVFALGHSPRTQFVDLDNDGDVDIYSEMVCFGNQGLDSTGVVTSAVSSETFSTVRELTLYQAFPNPFGPQTTLRFSLPSRGHVAITVHDARGRHIATLIDEPRSAGRHSVTWDTRDFRGTAVPSGVYLVHLTLGAERRARKLVIVR
jgi:hypothetical protein